jgi:hypothetical protein
VNHDQRCAASAYRVSKLNSIDTSVFHSRLAFALSEQVQNRGVNSVVPAILAGELTGRSALVNLAHRLLTVKQSMGPKDLPTKP